MHIFPQMAMPAHGVQTGIHLIAVSTVVEIPEIDKNGQRCEQRLVQRVLHSLEVHLVIVNVGRAAEREAAWNFFFDMSNTTILHVVDGEVDFGTGSARQWTAEAPLTATATCAQNILISGIPNGEGEVTARERIPNRSQFLI